LAPEGGEDIRKGCRKMNMEEISRTHAWKCKRPFETIPGIEGGGIKENHGGDEFNSDIL
jgi:hypothetical protein